MTSHAWQIPAHRVQRVLTEIKSRRVGLLPERPQCRWALAAGMREVDGIDSQLPPIAPASSGWAAEVGTNHLYQSHTCSRKYPRSQHGLPLATPPRFKVPPTGSSVKRWNFRKADWKRFCLLTDESVERLLPPDTSNIEGAYQDFCESLLSAAKLRGRRKNYVPCWDKECETFHCSFLRAPVGTDSDRAASSYYLDLNRTSWSDGREFSAPSASRALATGVEPYQQIHCQVSTLFSPVPSLGKLHRLATDEDLHDHGDGWVAAFAASISQPETANGAGYDASGMVSHSDLSWHLFSSTSASLTCQPPSPESMHMLTI